MYFFSFFHIYPTTFQFHHHKVYFSSFVGTFSLPIFFFKFFFQNFFVILNCYIHQHLHIHHRSTALDHRHEYTFRHNLTFLHSLWCPGNTPDRWQTQLHIPIQDRSTTPPSKSDGLEFKRYVHKQLFLVLDLVCHLCFGYIYFYFISVLVF